MDLQETYSSGWLNYITKGFANIGFFNTILTPNLIIVLSRTMHRQVVPHHLIRRHSLKNIIYGFTEIYT
tara:strand:+ start:799 stop:1005 length:207 start_codon:yes stop_codon:yes gene_type:complete